MATGMELSKRPRSRSAWLVEINEKHIQSILTTHISFQKNALVTRFWLVFRVLRLFFETKNRDRDFSMRKRIAHANGSFDLRYLG